MNGKLQRKFILSNDILNEKETKNTVRIYIGWSYSSKKRDHLQILEKLTGPPRPVYPACRSSSNMPSPPIT